MPGGRELLFTDTVGFIQKLPTQIVAAFRATLEEIMDADVLLHVVDTTHPQAAAQIEAVEDTLAMLEVDHLPTVMALNKVDALPDDSDVVAKLAAEATAVAVSALTGEGIDELLAVLETTAMQHFEALQVLLPYKRGDLVSLFHERGQVDDEVHGAEGVLVNGRLPKRLVPYFEPYKQTR
jgi:GTP-binding protein HflX